MQVALQRAALSQSYAPLKYKNTIDACHFPGLAQMQGHWSACKYSGTLFSVCVYYTLPYVRWGETDFSLSNCTFPMQFIN